MSIDKKLLKTAHILEGMYNILKTLANHVTYYSECEVTQSDKITDNTRETKTYFAQT